MIEGARAARAPSVVSGTTGGTPPLLGALRILLIATPAVALLAPYGFLFPFVSVRAVAFRALVLLAGAAALLLLMLRGGRLRLHRDSLFVAFGVYLAVIGAAAVFGPAPWQSIYGDLERMGGVVATAHLLLYFILLRSFFDDQHWQWYFRVAVAAATIVAAHAIVERYTVGAVTSLTGNPGTFGAYLLFHLAFAAVAALRSTRWERRLFVLSLAPLVIALLLSRNRSSLLGLALAGFCAVLLLSARDPRIRRYRIAFALAPLLLALIPIAGRLAPHWRLPERLPGVLGRAAGTFVPGGSDAMRVHSWQAGLDAFLDRPILGYGPENYRLIWAARQDSTGTALAGLTEFDRAHNAYVESLALTGVLGTAAYVLLWAAAFFVLFRAWQTGKLEPKESAVWFGVFVAYATYLFFWFEDVNSGIFWTASLALVGSRCSGAPLLTIEEAAAARRRLLPGLALLALLASLYLHSFEALRLARLLGTAESVPQSVEAKLATYRMAFASPAPQTLHTAPSFVRFMLTIGAGFQADRTDPYRAPLIDAGFQDGFRFIGLLQERDPRDPIHYQSEGSLALIALRFYQTREYYDRALAAFGRTIELSPTRLAPRYLLAETYAGVGKFDSALVTLEETRRRLGEVGSTYYYLAKTHRAAGHITPATQALLRAVQLGYVQHDFVDGIATELEQAGRAGEAAYLVLRTLQRGLGPLSEWQAPRTPEDTLTAARVLAGRLPVLFLRAGQERSARTAAEALARRHPTARSAAHAFIRDLDADRAARWQQRAPGSGLLQPVRPRRR